VRFKSGLSFGSVNEANGIVMDYLPHLFSCNSTNRQFKFRS